MKTSRKPHQSNLTAPGKQWLW